MHDGRRLEARDDIGEPCIRETPSGRCRFCILPRPSPATKIRLELGTLADKRAPVVQPLDIWTAAALGNEAAARLQGRKDASKERRVVEHPVKRGRAEHRIGTPRNRQRRSIGASETHACRKPRHEMPAGRLQHVRRDVNRDDMSARKAFEQPFRQPARAAADVQHAFVALERQPRKHAHPPRHVRVRYAVIRLGIPFNHL